MFASKDCIAFRSSSQFKHHSRDIDGNHDHVNHVVGNHLNHLSVHLISYA